MKKFDIPVYYKSGLINNIKNIRKDADPRKRDFTPTELDFGDLKIYLARHFGFCYGVENAIEIAYKAVDENPGKRVFLLSEMIHNPGVNEDLQKYGVDFLMDTAGNMLHEWSDLTEDDVIIIPAFGTTLEIEKKIEETSVNKYIYNTTCPFVEKVWKKSASLGEDDHTIIIHGKYNHEETRATFSHTVKNSPAVIVRDIDETRLLARFIEGEGSAEEFYSLFEGKYSPGFDPKKDFEKIGVVNQTTMLAGETQEIADYLKEVMERKYSDSAEAHFADTRDTLCYATNDNQRATFALAGLDADFAIVAGGANSSNTTHIVEILEQRFPVYFISDPDKIDENGNILSFNIHRKEEEIISNFLPEKKAPEIVITSGASCPDSVVEGIIEKIKKMYNVTTGNEEVIEKVILKYQN